MFILFISLIAALSQLLTLFIFHTGTIFRVVLPDMLQEIMDESDRLKKFIEDRAKDTLLRFTRMRQERHILGRYSTIGMGAPGGGSASRPHSGPYDQYGSVSSRRLGRYRARSTQEV